ncbi:hypothetical protein [Cytobacillus praedii]|uniref:Uncharacterized protein n=1 Tax=Cytobacillus praedii TaxID=1742358 RepID=A0A4V6NAR9_9BACI|nr:hypothetical protein [Cytobacillus praedii]TCJ01604.1 hypothetical protein E0Y62_23215 [Cytobacillus praedii]
MSSLPPRKKAKGFWNDTDGWSITDVLSIGFALLFAIVSFMMFVKLWTDELTMQSIDFFQVFSYPMIIILSGYFGDKIASKFNFNRNSKKDNKQLISEPTQSYEYLNEYTSEEIPSPMNDEINNYYSDEGGNK